MQTVALERAQAMLPDLVKQVAEGEEFTITLNGEPRAKLSHASVLKPGRAQAGSLKGKIWLAPDFNSPLNDFKSYME